MGAQHRVQFVPGPIPAAGFAVPGEPRPHVFGAPFQHAALVMEKPGGIPGARAMEWKLEQMARLMKGAHAPEIARRSNRQGRADSEAIHPEGEIASGAAVTAQRGRKGRPLPGEEGRP